MNLLCFLNSVENKHAFDLYMQCLVFVSMLKGILPRKMVFEGVLRAEFSLNEVYACILELEVDGYQKSRIILFKSE